MTATNNVKHIAVIGGGISGVTLAYLLSKKGLRVTVYERQNSLGGLASYIDYQGNRLDRFYHTILSSDMSMQQLIQETGIADRLHFTKTRQGFYDDGKLHPFDSPLDLLRFPPLTLLGRFRLGLQIFYAQFQRDWRAMDTIPVEQWLLRISGRNAFRKVWKPLLRAKFDTLPIEDIPATYIWSRLRRMLSTRQGVTSQEMMCYLEGGYYALIEAMIAHCEARRVAFCLNTAVEEIVIEDGRAVGVRTPDDTQHYDAVISTLPSPVLATLIPGAPDEFRDLLASQEYLGVICPLLILDRALTPYYVLNITDERVPFTAVVETTNLIDPVHVGGHHLVYLPKYITWQNEIARWPDDKVKAEWLKHLTRMFPEFQAAWIRAFLVQRARLVEPLRPIGTSDRIPTIKTPVDNFFMANTSMVYPDLNNGESVTRLATRVADTVAAELEAV